MVLAGMASRVDTAIGAREGSLLGGFVDKVLVPALLTGSLVVCAWLSPGVHMYYGFLR